MWEFIAANRRKSIVLLTVMAMVLIAAGMLIAEAVQPDAWIVGGLIAFVLWVVMALASYYGGDSILLASAGAREIQREDHPTLYNIVEEMKIASGLPKMPRVYIIDDSRPNAFATGRDPEHASVAVTAGLLNRLNRDEVQGVIAHEMAHVRNRDILYVTIAVVMVGVIALMADFFLRYMWLAGGRRSRGRGGGQAQALILILAIAFAILGPIAAQMLYFALSRRREYLADACGAQFTRYPEGLASALDKIARDPGMKEQRNRAMAPMYIINPAMAFGGAGLFSTHPPTQDRIRILRSMSGASLADYEAAYAKAKGGGLIPGGELKASRPVGVRPPGAEEPQRPEPSAQDKARETGDLLWKLSGYGFIACQCGARLKVPPGFRGPQVRCPRCERVHEVPRAQ